MCYKTLSSHRVMAYLSTHTLSLWLTLLSLMCWCLIHMYLVGLLITLPSTTRFRLWSTQQLRLRFLSQQHGMLRVRLMTSHHSINRLVCVSSLSCLQLQCNEDAPLCGAFSCLSVWYRLKQCSVEVGHLFNVVLITPVGSSALTSCYWCVSVYGKIVQPVYPLNKEDKRNTSIFCQCYPSVNLLHRHHVCGILQPSVGAFLKLHQCNELAISVSFPIKVVLTCSLLQATSCPLLDLLLHCLLIVPVLLCFVTWSVGHSGNLRNVLRT
ncbi:hypothetical protein PSPHG_CDS_0139 [Pseudomonas phage Psxphi15]